MNPLIWLHHTSKHSSNIAFQKNYQVLDLMLLCVGLISYASNPKPPLLIPKRNFRAINGDLSH